MPLCAEIRRASTHAVSEGKYTDMTDKVANFSSTNTIPENFQHIDSNIFQLKK